MRYGNSLATLVIEDSTVLYRAIWTLASDATLNLSIGGTDPYSIGFTIGAGEITKRYVLSHRHGRFGGAGERLVLEGGAFTRFKGRRYGTRRYAVANIAKIREFLHQELVDSATFRAQRIAAEADTAQFHAARAAEAAALGLIFEPRGDQFVGDGITITHEPTGGHIVSIAVETAKLPALLAAIRTVA